MIHSKFFFGTLITEILERTIQPKAERLQFIITIKNNNNNKLFHSFKNHSPHIYYLETQQRTSMEMIARKAKFECTAISSHTNVS